MEPIGPRRDLVNVESTEQQIRREISTTLAEAERLEVIAFRHDLAEGRAEAMDTLRLLYSALSDLYAELRILTW